MGRRRKRGGMAALGNSMTHHDRRHRKDNLITASGFGRRKRGQQGGLAGAMSLGDKMFKRGKKRGIVSMATSSLRERMTPSERAEIAEEASAEYERQEPRGDSWLLNFLRQTRDRFRR